MHTSESESKFNEEVFEFINSTRGEYEEESYHDAISGEAMIKELVDAARKVEMETFRKHGVYEKMPLEECWKNAGKALVGVKRVDTNKGDKANPEYRCRLVAKEFKKDKREDLFAATPSLEAKKMLFSLWASIPGMRLDFGDVARAYFHAKAKRKVYVDLSAPEFEEGKRGLLKKATCGTRAAAQNWEMEYTEMMVDADSGKLLIAHSCSTTSRIASE